MANYDCKPTRDLTGQKFGRLTVREYIPGGDWLCVCECGKRTKVNTYRLTAGLTRSCGCLRREVAAKKATRHGGANESLYHVLNAMHQRCENPESHDFKWYGAKGVKVCNEWALSKYWNFKAWALSHGYAPGLTIDPDRVRKAPGVPRPMGRH